MYAYKYMCPWPGYITSDKHIHHLVNELFNVILILQFIFVFMLDGFVWQA